MFRYHFTLPTTSNNGITGTWSPAINNTATTTYTFTPTAGLCATTKTMTVYINPNVSPTFTQVAAICSGGSLAPLPTTSNNGISGSWSPALNNTATTTYTFTPAAGECGTTTTMTITVNPKTVPTFTQVAAICTGGSLSALPTTSNNGITGTWSPALNNTATTTYTFTPTGGCNSTTTMTITLNPIVTPTIHTLAPICSGGTFSLPTTSANSITGTWSPAINNTITTNYTFIPSAGQCATNATTTVTVVPANVSFSGLKSTYCSSESTVTLTPSVAGGTFSGPGVTGNVFNPATAGNGSVTVRYDFLTIGNYTGSSIAYLPKSASGTSVTLYDDQVSGSLPVGFNFNFYGNTYNQFYISSNGFISFDPAVGTGCCSGKGVPTNNTTNNLIAAMWDDLDPSLGGSITYSTTGTAPNRMLVVSFNGIYHYDSDDSTTSQIVLYEGSNVIEIFTANAAGSYNRTQGIENANGTLGMAVPGRNNSIWTPNNDAYRFTPVQTTLCTGSSQTVTVNAKTTPTFSPVYSICIGETLNPLPTTSTNGITGTWSPALNNMATTNYVFTPSEGQCANSYIMTIVVKPLATFDQVPPICLGGTLPSLPSYSTNGYPGSWSPELSNTATTTYTFKPSSGCTTPVTMTIPVIPVVTPIFSDLSILNDGAINYDLPTISSNGINGIWNPSTLAEGDNNYVFTPEEGICAATITQSYLWLQPQTITAVDDDFTGTPFGYSGGTTTKSVFENDLVFNEVPNTNSGSPSHVTVSDVHVEEKYFYGRATMNLNGTLFLSPANYDGPITVSYKITNDCGYSSIGKATVKYSGPPVVTPYLRKAQQENSTALSDRIAVYPNPSNGIFNFDLTAVEGDYDTVEVFNMLGSKVFESRLISKSANTIDLSNMTYGSYLAKVSGKNGSQAFKLIKQ